MAKYSRRTFNNMVIVGVLLFIALINLPTYLRSHLVEDEKHELRKEVLDEGVIPLFPSNINVKSLQFPNVTLIKGTPWQANAPLSVSASALANRWLNLAGTEVDSETFQKLEAQLLNPSTLLVELAQDNQPVELRYYELPTFWLIQSWQGPWIAVSVDSSYLFP